jgi:hypothetical protein
VVLPPQIPAVEADGVDVLRVVAAPVADAVGVDERRVWSFGLSSRTRTRSPTLNLGGASDSRRGDTPFFTAASAKATRSGFFVSGSGSSGCSR